MNKASQIEISKLYKKLDNKYKNQRKINEKVLNKQKNRFQKIMSILGGIICFVCVFISILFCVSVINSKQQNTPASFFGYSTMKIASNSMMSDYNIGDNILVHSVDPKSLKVGDRIAFYAYSASYTAISPDDFCAIDNSSSKTKLTMSFKQLFGIQSNLIKQAAKNNSMLVFHQIIEVGENTNGIRLFKTKGINNQNADTWIIEEDLVFGVLINSPFANFLANAIGKASSSKILFLMLIIPVILLTIMIAFEIFKSLQILKLEQDCIEEKRKITDPICIKNNIGLQMKPKDKLKILAQSSKEEKTIYANLLWGEENIPYAIKKYFLERRIILRPLEKLLNINRKCEEMLHQGTPIEKVGLYYYTEKQKISEKLEEMYKKIDTLNKSVKAK